MDSFYDVPRKAPVPTSLEKVLPTPLVPEASMIFHNVQYQSNGPSYKTWSQNNSYRCYSNKENQNDSFLFMSNTASMIKKQVRFESPALSSKPDPLRDTNLQNYYPPVDSNNKNPQVSCPSTLNKELEEKTFQQIYMSNIPNRHLDLSIIDISEPQKNNNIKVKTTMKETELTMPSQERGESCQNNFGQHKAVNSQLTNDIGKNLPQTYKEFLSLQSKPKIIPVENNTVTDILNYKRETSRLSRPNDSRKISDNHNLATLPVKQPTNILTDSNRYNCHNSREIVPRNYKDTIRFFGSQSKYEQEKLPQSGSIPVKRDDNTQNTKISLDSHSTKQYLESTKSIESENESEPSVKDLLKIIQQQNEQILLLQKQVSSLIQKTDTQKQIEVPSTDMLYSKKYITSTQHEMCNNPIARNITPRKGPLSKFSIDMMTSFEVSFRRQQNEKFKRKLPDYVNHEPQIEEVTETESAYSNVLSGIKPLNSNCDKKPIETSLCLQVPLEIREDCPSPEPSIQINMNDYESSDEDSTDEVPMAVYANVMDQIGKLLKKAQNGTIPSRTANMGDQIQNRESKNVTMSKVKEATLKHLRSIGINLNSTSDTECSDGSEISCNYTPSEVSFAVKQLLMKYLPDEYLSKINTNANESPQASAPLANEATNLIPPRPEFSFATVQYMKKYNLLQNNNECTVKQNPKLRTEEPVVLTRTAEGKILDITALKQQPKLL